MGKKSNTEEFVEKSNIVHKNVYTYGNTVYDGNDKPVIITCKKHGDFKQIAGYHLDGNGCQECGREKQRQTRRSNTEEFKGKVIKKYGNEFDLSKVVYVNARTRVIIICRKHGEMKKLPSDFLHGYGCRECGIERSHLAARMTTDEFVEKAKIVHEHNILLDYSQTVYVTADIDVTIICKKHGPFDQSPGNHLQGHSCPFCINKTEGIFKAWFEEHVSKNLKHNTGFDWCRSLETGRKYRMDFIYEEKKVIFEIDGPQHFKQIPRRDDVRKTRRKDFYKMCKAIKNGYSVVRIYQEDIFNNTIDWKKIVIDVIKNLNKQCEVYISSDLEKYAEFHKEMLDYLKNNMQSI